MKINSKTWQLFGMTFFISCLMAMPVKAEEMHLKLPTDMNGYHVKILDEQGEVYGSEIADVRGEVRIDVPENERTQVLVLRDETISLQELERFGTIFKIKENIGLVLFAFLSGLGSSCFLLRKKYRRVFEWIDDPEVDD